MDRFWSKVQKSDGCWNWAKGTHPEGYGAFWYEGKMRLAHRVAVALDRGVRSETLGELDHRCRNRLCVRPDHLREVTRKQNSEHYVKMRSDNTTGVRGVWVSGRRFKTQTTHNGERYTAGSFGTLEEADRAIRELRSRLHSHNDLDREAAK